MVTRCIICVTTLKGFFKREKLLAIEFKENHMSIRLWSSTNKKKRKFFVLKAALLTVMLSTSMGQKAFAQNANWTNDFIGELTFSLMDDPTYSTDYTSMNALSQELMRMRGLLNEKRQHL
ncbi:MAG: hypothetical protein ACI9QD_000517, partial [Thermoproteota archaeon]